MWQPMMFRIRDSWTNGIEDKSDDRRDNAWLCWERLRQLSK